MGKFSLAAEIAGAAGVVDLLAVRGLTTADAREVIDFVSVAPLQAEARTALVDLDGASPASCHVLLKTLEEPPPLAQIWLVASSPPLATVTSRCHVLRFGALAPQDVRRALLAAGLPYGDAEALSRLSGGSVGHALALRPVLAEKAHVLALLKALSARNWTLVAQVLRGVSGEEGSWSGASVEALRLWLADVMSGTETFWKMEETYGLARSIPAENLRRALSALGMSPMRPSLSISLAAHALLGSDEYHTRFDRKPGQPLLSHA